jgi:hypothetical protein
VAIPAVPNVTVDVYRGYDATFPNPLPGARPAAAGVPGFLKPAAPSGRVGYQAAGLHWTDALWLDAGVDVRDAYNSQLAGATPQTADTVLLRDYPIKGRCTAFYVVLVLHQTGPARGDYLEVRLDRARPRVGGCADPRCCSSDKIPATLTLTLGAAYCLFPAGTTLPLTYDSNQNFWQGGLSAGGHTLTARLRCNATALRHELSLGCDGGQDPYQGPDCGYTCVPFFWCRAGVGGVSS